MALPDQNFEQFLEDVQKEQHRLNNIAKETAAPCKSREGSPKDRAKKTLKPGSARMGILGPIGGVII